MVEGWHPDPVGRHAERYFDGVRWSARVRDHGIENVDRSGLDAVAAPKTPAGTRAATPAASPFAPAAPPAPVAPSVAAGSAPWSSVAEPSAAPTAAVPVAPPASPGVPAYSLEPASGAGSMGGGVPPAGLGTPPSSHSRRPESAPARARRGIPAMLAIAVILAAFPAVGLLGMGSIAVLAGNDISDASDSDVLDYGGGYDAYGDYTGFGPYDSDGDYVGYEPSGSSSFDSADDGTFADEVDAFGEDTAEAGFILLAIGGAMFAAALLAAMGSNVGRFITAAWLVLAALYMLNQVQDMPDGAGPYLAVIIGPPILAVIGLFTPASNAVFRKSTEEA